MNTTEQNRGPFLRKGPLAFFQGGTCRKGRARNESGSVLFYIFIAVALLGALTFAFTKDSRTNVSTQIANKTAQELYVQVNMIRAALMECALAYPAGGPDVDANGTVEITENPNTPYPLNPTDDNNPSPPGDAATDAVRDTVCPGAPSGQRNIFQGANNQGRFLPPPPQGYSEWLYINDMADPSDGVRIQITAPGSATDIDALTRLKDKFSSCQAQTNFESCGSNCFTAWINRKLACP